jgi:hypothetical protein
MADPQYLGGGPEFLRGGLRGLCPFQKRSFTALSRTFDGCRREAVPGSLGLLCLRSVNQAIARKTTNSTAKRMIKVTVASLCSMACGDCDLLRVSRPR